MDLTVYSQNLMKDAALVWHVPAAYYDPMFDYLVWGISPGNFFTSVLANNFKNAVQHSHVGNTIQSLKNLVGWMHDCFPAESFGSYTTVTVWCKMSDQQRRSILENTRLIYTEPEEIMLTLRDLTPSKPVLC